MNFIDIIIIIPIVWFAYKGLSKGFVNEIAQLFALIGGIFIAANFSHFVGEKISCWLSINEKYINVVAFIITFAGVILLVVIVRKSIEKIIKASSLNFINKIGGLIFGALKAAFLLSCLFYVINRVDDRAVILKAETRNDSLFYYPVSALAPIIAPKLKVSTFIGKEESCEKKDDEENIEKAEEGSLF